MNETPFQPTAGEPSYAIGELAALADVTPRTIRYYTAEGLLPPPESDGRYARYGTNHLSRLRLIAQLKEAYLPLHEIRQRIAPLDLAQIAAMLRETAPPPRRIAEPSSAATYITDVIARQQLAQPSPPGAPQLRAPVPTMAAQAAAPAINRARADLVRPPLPQVQPQGEAWRRMVLRPGVELHVREPLDQAAQIFLDQVQHLIVPEEDSHEH
ncbi:MAG: MerR family transcriptional regulator [Roseiflexaceae bacterium]|nr:MerR family transcriptional regulator [Roseiflexaceae bacterium]